MEFYNEKLLPRGLPEIIAQLTPYDFYPDTKVIAFPRKQKRGLLGQVDSSNGSYRIKLYPTIITFHCNYHEGTISFSLWLSFLDVALHEMGHLATRHLRQYVDTGKYENDSEYHNYVENLADQWRDLAKARILRVDPRLGQPSGFITGYPGIVAFNMRQGLPTVHHRRLNDFRGARCGGQVTLGVVANKMVNRLFLSQNSWDWEYRNKLEGMVRNQIHRAVKNLGIQRYAFSNSGRRYLMFNVAEAEAVYEWLINHEKVLADSYQKLKLTHTKTKHGEGELVGGGVISLV